MRVVRLFHAGRESAHRLRDRALVANGVSLTYVVPARWAGPEQSDAIVAEPTFRIVELPVERPGDINRHRLADPAAFARLIEETRPDLIDIAEEPFSSVLHQVLRLIPPALPVVAYTAQNIAKRWPPPFHLWERKAFERLYGIYPCSKQAASVVRGKGYGGLVLPLPLGVDTAAYRPGNQSSTDPEIRLALVGRMEPYKGVLDAVKILHRLHEVRQCRLTLIGEGPMLQPALDLARRLGIGGLVDALPWQPGGALAELYRQMHVVMVPSRATDTWVEQFGRTIVEAQAAGCLVAAYASGSIPEVAGPAGIIAPEGQSECLAESLSAVLSDDTAFQDRRYAGIEQAGQKDWTVIARDQVRFYEQAMHRPPGPTLRASPSDLRARASAEFGPSARCGAQSRPFALPVLRRNSIVSRTLGRALDGAAELRFRRDLPPARRNPDRDRRPVVFVGHTAVLSGGEIQLVRILPALASRIPVEVVLGEAGLLVDELTGAGHHVAVLPLASRAGQVRRSSVTARRPPVVAVLHAAWYSVRLSRYLRRSGAQIVHTTTLKSAFYGGLAARLSGIPCVWGVNDLIDAAYLPSAAVMLVRWAARHIPAAVVANSEATLRSLRLPVDRRALVVYPPAPLEWHTGHGRAARLSPRTPFTAAIVGRLAPWKGQDIFIRAFAEAFSDGLERAKIIGSPLFGEDDYARRLEEVARALGVADRIEFCGFHRDITVPLREVDVLVHASMSPEPFGQVILEGLVLGIPVIAANAGGPREIIEDGVSGILCTPGDVPAFAHALIRLRDSPELCQQLIRNGLERLSDFGPEPLAARLCDLYEELAGPLHIAGEPGSLSLGIGQR